MDILKRQLFTILILSGAAAALLWPEAFKTWFGLSLLLFVGPSIQLIMFGMGTTLTATDFEGVVKRPWGVAIGVVLQFSIMPLSALCVAHLLGFTGELAAGMVLIGSVAGGMASNVIAYLAKANVALSVTMTCVSTLLSPLVTPVLMKYLAGAYVEIDTLKMMVEMFKIVIIPVLAGYLVRLALGARYERHRSAIDAVLQVISMSGILFSLVVCLAPNRDLLLEAGLTVLLSSVLHTSIGYSLGYAISKLLGRFLQMDERDARTVAIEVGMQNGGMAAALAINVLHSSVAALPANAAAVWMNVSGSMLANFWSKRPPRSAVLLLLAFAMLALPASAESYRVEVLDDGIWRVRAARSGEAGGSLLNRYGILEKLPVRKVGDSLAVLPVAVDVRPVEKGWSMSLAMAKAARVYGLGDTGRAGLNRRGRRYDLRVENIKSYIPIPMVMTSDGWGAFVNTTYTSHFDIGVSDPERIEVAVDGGDVDFYVFAGRDYRAQLSAYTRITGRPALMPSFAFGFAYVANQWIDKYELTEEAYKFRSLSLPCDIIGLEPGWMEYFYDFTTKKNWSPARFSFPAWTKSRAVSWVGALDRMRFNLSLWLCMNYDVFVFEEACAAGKAKPTAAATDWQVSDTMPDVWQDEHIEGKFTEADAQTPPLRTISDRATGAMRHPVMRPDGKSGVDESGEEPWFEHLKKFVDRGARCFKLDASQQCGEFPGRIWAKRYHSDEVHNAYPLVYGKQMAQGFEAYTGRRAMVYTSCGYAGLQRYVATWAGDTGGGLGSLVSVLNLGLSGQPSQTCDMDIDNARSLHFAFFAPWCQLNNWDYFQQPWYREAEDLSVLREYMQLRYRFFPYLYSTAAESSRTGWPIMRPLAFAYPEERAYDNVVGTYLIGDSLLVSAYSDTVEIPPGVWYEWFTGRAVVGPKVEKAAVDAHHGGGLYVKAGSIVPMWPVRQHLEKGWNDSVALHAYLGADGAFDWYEDDGESLGYRSGESAISKLTLRGNTLKIGARRGAFRQMPTHHELTVVWHDGAKSWTNSLGRVGANVETVISKEEEK